MKNVVLFLTGSFDGLYGWGSGWNPEKKILWDNYWRNTHDIFWKFVPSTDFCSSDTLVSTSGSIYLHPFRFKTVLHGCGVTCDGKYLSSEIESLTELCNKCAEVTGSKFNLQVSEEIECDFGDLNKVA